MKKIKHVGNLIVICSLIFIIYTFVKADVENISKYFKVEFFLHSIILVILYSSGVFLLAIGWEYILTIFTQAKQKYAGVRIYLKTNIVKYLPGNVFHLASRQLYCRSISITQQDMIFVSLWEIVSLIVAAFSFLLLCLIIIQIDINSKVLKLLDNVLQLSMVFIVISSIVIISIPHIKNRLRLLMQKIIVHRKSVLISFALHFLFFTIMSTIFAVLIKELSDGPFLLQDFIYVMFVSVVSWFLGFIVPGSPGGIGVREFVVLTMLKHAFITELLLASVIIFRLITVFGELLALGINVGFSSLQRSRSKRYF